MSHLLNLCWGTVAPRLPLLTVRAASFLFTSCSAPIATLFSPVATSPPIPFVPMKRGKSTFSASPATAPAPPLTPASTPSATARWMWSRWSPQVFAPQKEGETCEPVSQETGEPPWTPGL